ncbi:MAG TPA: hypothetical protein VI894_03405 [Candidatus Nanoarchaeia archaeon]|nr:hypothetical protein [Candidatus Nanoarchaeia archaeon]
MNLNFLQKLFVTFTNPVKIISHVIFLAVLFYSLWVHWVPGIFIAIAVMILGDIYSILAFRSKAHYNRTERTFIHLAKVHRFAWIVISFLALCYGIWIKNLPLMIVSIITTFTIVIYTRVVYVL